MTYKMVFDVESVGLHGEGFAVGFVVIDQHGAEVEAHQVYCDPRGAEGRSDDLAWVQENVTVGGEKMVDPMAVRNFFWASWHHFKDKYPGLELWTDCCWPVETGFLSACIADDPVNRRWEGPYPLFDVANILKAAGENPVGSFGRLPNEEPAHNALNDARQSARVLRMFQTLPMKHPVG